MRDKLNFGKFIGLRLGLAQTSVFGQEQKPNPRSTRLFDCVCPE